jgi:L-ascorbate metabolism protein UlaG (beta-lactamase superfamily)
MYSERAGPLNLVGPKRVRPPAVKFDDLPRISTVLLSHNQYDHCDLRTLRMLAASGTRIFFAGDTAYAGFFRDVRQRLGPIVIWRSCPSALTSHAGSCSPFT